MHTPQSELVRRSELRSTAGNGYLAQHPAHVPPAIQDGRLNRLRKIESLLAQVELSVGSHKALADAQREVRGLMGTA